MSTLSITKSYEQGDVLFEADLDAIKTSIETFFNETGVNDDNLQERGINGTTKVIDGTITTALLDTDSITAEKIAASNITTAKIAASAVTAAKLPAASVTRAKMAALGQQISDDFDVDVDGTDTETLESVSITTTGRPVIVAFVPDSTGVIQWYASYPSDIYSISTAIQLKRGSTVIGTFTSAKSMQSSGNPAFTYHEIPPSVWTLDTPAAGTYTYSIVGQGGDLVGTHDNQTTTFKGRLLAFEVQ